MDFLLDLLNIAARKPDRLLTGFDQMRQIHYIERPFPFDPFSVGKNIFDLHTFLEQVGNSIDKRWKIAFKRLAFASFVPTFYGPFQCVFVALTIVSRWPELATVRLETDTRMSGGWSIGFGSTNCPISLVIRGILSLFFIGR